MDVSDMDCTMNTHRRRKQQTVKRVERMLSRDCEDDIKMKKDKWLSVFHGTCSERQMTFLGYVILKEQKTKKNMRLFFLFFMEQKEYSREIRRGNGQNFKYDGVSSTFSAAGNWQKRHAFPSYRRLKGYDAAINKQPTIIVSSFDRKIICFFFATWDYCANWVWEYQAYGAYILPSN